MKARITINSNFLAIWGTVWANAPSTVIDYSLSPTDQLTLSRLPSTSDWCTSTSVSPKTRLHRTNSIIHGVFHLSARFPGERRLSRHRMSGCHTWTKTHSWDGRLSGGLSTSRCHDGPLQWWRLRAGLSDMVTTSAEIMNKIKQPSKFFFSKCKQALNATSFMFPAMQMKYLCSFFA